MPATSVTRTATNGIMKFHRHVGRLQQAAHQPAENFSRCLCMCIPAQKIPPLTKNPRQK
jgi:hypothetical protein